MIQINSGYNPFMDKTLVNMQTRRTHQDNLEEFGRLVEKKSEELDIRKSGDYKPKIQTGANSYSEDGWNRMMENFDSIQDSVRAEMADRLEDFQV